MQESNNINPGSMAKHISLLTFLSWVILYVPIVLVNNQIVRDAYMDEPFHAGQTLEIWNHPLKPKWNPKITTPSGLYYVTLAITGWTEPTLDILRGSSAIWNALSLAVIASIARTRSKTTNKSLVSSWLVALKVMTFPPIFFVGMLYYTDAGALFFVMAAWLAMIYHQSALSLLLSLSAVWFRQTNAVWIFFLGGLRFAELLNVAMDDPRSISPFDYVKVMFGSEKFKFGRAVQRSVGYALVPAIYLGLTMISTRGALVHGDESNHAITFHGAQMCYFVVVLLGFSGLGLQALFSPKESIRVALSNWGGLVLCFVLSFAAVHKFSVTHQFLLADNRHFGFYLWSKFFRRHEFAKYFPIPVYAFGFLFSFKRLFDASRSTLITLGYFVCATLSLLPLPLFEPRYFIVPLAVYTVLISERTATKGEKLTDALVVMANMIINASALMMFWFKPFQWPDGSTARFMW